MGKIREPFKVKLIAGLISSSPALVEEAKARLSARWGAIDLVSETMAFDYTDYYEQEMGRELKRCWVSFEALRHPFELAAIKVATNELEAELSGSPRRTINIDPGYLTMAKLVLASAKDFSHRIYLDQGIYAEVTLHYRHDAFAVLPWTYPDYQSPVALRFLTAARDRLHEQLRGS